MIGTSIKTQNNKMKNFLIKSVVFVALFLLFQYMLDSGFYLMNINSDIAFFCGAVMVAVVYALAFYGAYLLGQRTYKFLKSKISK